MFLGSGTYGLVRKDIVALKESRDRDKMMLVPYYTILEVSILRHLDQRSRLIDGDSYPFPNLYSIGVNICDDRLSIMSNIRMSIEGESLHNLCNWVLLQDQQPLIYQHLDRILDAVRMIHRCGIIHGDLTLKNILIKKTNDLSDEINIIDFGISSLNTMCHDHYYHDLYFIPESYYRHEYTPLSDIWILGCNILHYCLGYQYITKDITRFRELLPIRYRYSTQQLFNLAMSQGNIRTAIKIPTKIQLNLRSRLRLMLNVHPLDRCYQYDILTVVDCRQWSFNDLIVPQTIIDNFKDLIDIFILMLRAVVLTYQLNLYHITVGIDVISRYYRSCQIIMDSDQLILLAYVTFITILNRKLDKELLLEMLSLYQLDCYRVINVQVALLEALEWRIFTNDNTLAITGNNYSVTQILDLIARDPYRGRYCLHLSNELKDRYRILMDEIID